MLLMLPTLKRQLNFCARAEASGRSKELWLGLVLQHFETRGKDLIALVFLVYLIGGQEDKTDRAPDRPPLNRPPYTALLPHL